MKGAPNRTIDLSFTHFYVQNQDTGKWKRLWIENFISVYFIAKKQTVDRPQENIVVQNRPAAPISENVHIFFNTDLSTVSHIKMTRHNTEYLAKTRNENSLKWSVMLCTTLNFSVCSSESPCKGNNHSSITGQIARSSLIACETDFSSYGFLWLIWHLFDFIFELKLDFLVISWKDKQFPDTCWQPGNYLLNSFGNLHQLL